MSDSHGTTTLITTTTTPSALYIPWLSNDQCRGGVVVATTRCCVDAMTQAQCVCAGDRGAQGLARREDNPHIVPLLLISKQQVLVSEFF